MTDNASLPVPLKRPVALVTGGRRGIGLAIARCLAEGGFDVAISGQAADAVADDAVASLRQLGARAMFVAFDISDLPGHAAALDAIEAVLGPVDLLVNNAGIAAPVRGDLLGLLPDNLDRVLRVNLYGTVFLTQTTVNRMLARTALHTQAVVTVTSVSADLASPERADYCMSKAALAMWVKNLALRLAETPIQVFEVRPGVIRSDMTAGVSEKYDRLIAGGLVPTKRWGEGVDIGRIIVALAKGDFGFATGAVIQADGGLAIPRL